MFVLRWGILGIVAWALPRNTLGFPGFVGDLPNGDLVPGERKPMATGHVNPQGAGERNQFGKDFESADFKWTKSLCLKDSDGDGRSNGEELGDPECIWKVPKRGKPPRPQRSTGITHPGVPDELKAAKEPVEPSNEL
mmetsp:Transcript_82081/g.190615  ORF Transcript_82081/g.190615 Transcript_82081/m.190615 type:complete len:137 (+) Transcript_82081:121-531(+)